MRGQRPNIVLIVVDDLGARDLSCYGSTFHETPRIDALAAEGMRFDEAYAASPVCSPSRASLMTGKYPARVGITQYLGGASVGRLADVPYFSGLPENEYTLARALRDEGYRTWHVGKWHLGSRQHWPERHGFDVNLGGCNMGSPHTYWSPYGIPTLEDGPDGEYLTDRLTDEAIALLRTPDERPFFLNLWHYAVHIPLEAPVDLVARFEGKADELGLDREPLEPGEEMPAWHLTGERVVRRRYQSHPVYAAMLANLDANVGRLLDALEETGQADDTLLIVTSDNGGLATAEGSPTSNAPLAEGKGWMQEGGVRVPFLVRWPGHLPAGAVSDLPFSGPDLYPTLLAAAGAQPRPQQHVDGVDLLPAWTGRHRPDRPLFWHYPHYSNQGSTPGAAVRDGRYKLVRFFEHGREALFDLAADVEERHDVAGRHPGIVERLGRLLDGWLEDVDAEIPRPNPYERFRD